MVSQMLPHYYPGVAAGQFLKGRIRKDFETMWRVQPGVLICSQVFPISSYVFLLFPKFFLYVPMFFLYLPRCFLYCP